MTVCDAVYVYVDSDARLANANLLCGPSELAYCEGVRVGANGVGLATGWSYITCFLVRGAGLKAVLTSPPSADAVIVRATITVPMTGTDGS